MRCSMPWMPASSTNVSATSLKPSESSSYDSDWLSGTAAPISCARVSNSRPMPLASIGLLVAIPGHALDPDRGDVAAEAAEPLDQRHLDPGPCRGQRGGKTRRAGADDQHVGLVDDVDLAGGFGDGAEGRAAGGSGHGPCIIARFSSRWRAFTPRSLPVHPYIPLMSTSISTVAAVAQPQQFSLCQQGEHT